MSTILPGKTWRTYLVACSSSKRVFGESTSACESGIRHKRAVKAPLQDSLCPCSIPLAMLCIDVSPCDAAELRFCLNMEGNKSRWGWGRG